MTKIDALWDNMRAANNTTVHRRVDDRHPLDLYAELDPACYPGLILFCSRKPPELRQMKAITLERGQRTDGRWWLRLSLHEASLRAVFSGLCHDIITFTRAGVSADSAPAAIVARVERWRSLLEGDHGGLSANGLRGLIGELLVLHELLDHLVPSEAVSCWNGPLGSPQDFMLPDGLRIEVKTVHPSANSIRINGLGQLDPGTDPLELRIIQLADTRLGADGAITAPLLINALKERVENEPLVLNELESRLAAGGWHNHPRHDEFAVRFVGSHSYRVAQGFPRITRANVPAGVSEVNYNVDLAAARDFIILESDGI